MPRAIKIIYNNEMKIYEAKNNDDDKNKKGSKKRV